MDESIVSGEDTSEREHSDASAEERTEFKAPLPKEHEGKEQANPAAPVISIIEPKLDYTPPPFAVTPEVSDCYGLEVIKNGTLIDRIDFGKRKAATFVAIGRLPSCDVHLEHPTISRHHCILQYGEDLMNRTGKGWHIYDLNSTHGTRLNKKKIPPKQYIRIRVGHVMQFGGSTRIMTLFGPESDVEAEWEYSPTEMKRMIEQKKLYDKIQKEKAETTEGEKESDGVMWGMDYDEELAYAQAHESDDIQDREEKYRDDPLKVLSRFFEKEGFDMEFTYEESGTGHSHKWTCSIELPVDTAAGQSLAASATCSGSKKEAQALCAFNACRTLDMHGVLFRSSNEVRKKAKNLADNDYYDSDEDTYFDRTGQIEESRENRRQRALESKGKSSTEAETFETLTKKIASTSEELNKVEKQLEDISAKVEKEQKEVKDDDDLDQYCEELEQSYGNRDSLAVKTEKSILRQRLVYLKHEKERLEKLAKIAKPVELPTLKIASNQTGNARATGSLSAATMKKLMKLRKTKLPASTEEKQKDIGMELPPDAFIKEAADSVPFTAETEEDEKPSTSGDTASVMKVSTEAVCTDGEKELNQPATSKVECISQEQSVKGNPEKHVADVPSAETGEEEVAEPDLVQIPAADEKQISTPKDVRPTKRKRIRVRDETSLKRGKTGDYGEGEAHKEDYVMWMPPENQKGDGTNALNAKFAGRY